MNGEVLAGFGGGIYNAGTLTVTGGVVSSNVAGAGGGIYNAGTATVGHCTLSGNAAVSGNIYSTGGGIYNAGTAGALKVLDSSFNFNKPDNIFGPYTDGGGNTFS